jgi:phosphoribosylaminoimidazole (AIR) synthetase
MATSRKVTEGEILLQKDMNSIGTGLHRVGLALARILYLAGGTSYMASNSQDKARAAIESMMEAVRDHKVWITLNY